MKYSGLVLLFVMAILNMVLADSHGVCLKPTGPLFGGWKATKKSFKAGSVVTFYCLPGYNLVGNQRAICATDGLYFFWVGNTPKCIPHG